MSNQIINFGNSTITNIQIGNNLTMINGKPIEKLVVCKYCKGKKHPEKKCENCGANNE